PPTTATATITAAAAVRSHRFDKNFIAASFLGSRVVRGHPNRITGRAGPVFAWPRALRGSAGIEPGRERPSTARVERMDAGTKPARGRATREQILAAASRLISERGVAETSVDDVIERAGASKSQLYHYFDDRADLLRNVVAHNADAVLGEL